MALRDGEPYLALARPAATSRTSGPSASCCGTRCTAMNLQEAIDAPAWHVDHFPASFWPRRPGPPPGRRSAPGRGDDRRALSAAGHEVVVGPAWSEGRITAAHARRPAGGCAPRPIRAACRATPSAADLFGLHAAGSYDRSPSIVLGGEGRAKLPGEFAMGSMNWEPQLCHNLRLGQHRDNIAVNLLQNCLAGSAWPDEPDPRVGFDPGHARLSQPRRGQVRPAGMSAAPTSPQAASASPRSHARRRRRQVEWPSAHRRAEAPLQPPAYLLKGRCTRLTPAFIAIDAIARCESQPQPIEPHANGLARVAKAQ